MKIDRVEILHPEGGSYTVSDKEVSKILRRGEREEIVVYKEGGKKDVYPHHRIHKYVRSPVSSPSYMTKGGEDE